jgi:hypothetical protein
MMIDRIKKLLSQPAQATVISADWTAIYKELKSELPADYVEFIDAYGLGSIGDFLSILHPGTRNKHLNLLEQLAKQRLVVDEVREYSGPEFKAQLFPKPGGLIPWGVTGNGDFCFWKTGDADPLRWRVVIYDSKYEECETYAGTMTEFLADTLSGKRRNDIFPEDFPPPGRTQFVPHRDEVRV